MSKHEKFVPLLDEAFDAIIKGRIEDVTESVKNLTLRIEQEVNTSRSEPDSIESVELSTVTDPNNGLGYPPIG